VCVFQSISWRKANDARRGSAAFSLDSGPIESHHLHTCQSFLRRTISTSSTEYVFRNHNSNLLSLDALMPSRTMNTFARPSTYNLCTPCLHVLRRVLATGESFTLRSCYYVIQISAWSHKRSLYTPQLIVHAALRAPGALTRNQDTTMIHNTTSTLQSSTYIHGRRLALRPQQCLPASYEACPSDHMRTHSK